MKNHLMFGALLSYSLLSTFQYLEMIETIYGLVPSKSNCYRFAGKFMYKTKALKEYEESFLEQCVVYKDKNIEGNLRIQVTVYYPNRKSDIDNSLKVLLDMMQKVKAFDNDNKVAEIEIFKRLDKENPRVEFSITVVDYII